MSDFWQPTPESLKLSSNHVDVWLFHLKDLSNAINEFYGLLSYDERKRADKLKIEDKRQQYIITRGTLRQRLALLTNSDPEDFVFEYLEHGKPVLASNQKYNGITFNVSHSYELALIAISKKNSLGIDIEKVNRQSNYDSLVTRYFSKQERSEFNALPEKIKARAFCACWTRKEALIKAIGDGATYGLDTFDVSVDPEIQNPMINLHKPGVETWSLINLPVNDDYMASVVSNGGDVNVRCWR